MREGWSAFYRNLEKLAIGAVRANLSDRSTIPVRPVHHIGQTDRVTQNWLGPLTDENPLR
jgi:hypothetical protein